jgi:hypothetical protein
MNIQAEKIELIRLITEIKSDKVLMKIREILAAGVEIDDDTTLSESIMINRLNESRRQIEEGKGVKISLDDIWK